MPSGDVLVESRPYISWWSALTVGLLCALAGGLSAFQAFTFEPTMDEVFSWRLTRYPIPDLLRSTALDVHPPLYYLVLKGWSGIVGDHIVALRSLSLLMRIASVGVIYFTSLAASALFQGPNNSLAMRHAAAILSATLLALSPDHLEAGASARMYSQMVLLTLAGHYFLFRGMNSPESRGWWLGYGVALGMCCLTHNGGVLLVCAHGVAIVLWWCVGRTRRITGESAPVPNVPVGGVVLAGLAAALIYAPWVSTLMWQVQVVSRGYWIGALNVAELVAFFHHWFTAMPYSGMRLAYLSVIPHAFLLLCVIVRHPIGRHVALHALLPWLLVILISYSWKTSILQQRYLLFAHVSLILMWGLSLLVLRCELTRLVTVWLLISAATYGIAESPVELRSSISSSMDLLQQKARRGDQLLIAANHVNLVRYHLARRNMEALQVVGFHWEDPMVSGRHVVHVASLKPSEFLTGDQLLTLQPQRLWTLTFPDYHALPLSQLEWVESWKTFGSDQRIYTLSLYRSKVHSDHYEE